MFYKLTPPEVHNKPEEVLAIENTKEADEQNNPEQKSNAYLILIKVYRLDLIITFSLGKEKPESLISESEIFAEHTDFYLRQLGCFAQEALNKGEPVPDDVIVHIIAEKIRSLPSDNLGWILDGFPSTFLQAKFFEKALTGYDEDKPVPDKPKKDSILAPNPKPHPPKPKHKSGVDFVVYFDLSDDSALKRSIGRYSGTISKKNYQINSNPPPEGSITGINKVETIEPVKDSSNEMEQIQHRLTAFEDEWSIIRKFYENYAQVIDVNIENFSESSLGDELQKQIDLYEEMCEKKRLDELKRKRIQEELMELQRKKKEEEALAAAQKKAEEEAEITRKLQEEKEAHEKAAAEGFKLFTNILIKNMNLT